MASAAGLRPNHYEVLGLDPTASQDDIARAFAKAMSMFGAHSVAGAAQLSIAFETLRNPAKRRAYDEAIGIKPEPEPRQGPTAVSFRISARLVGPEPHVEQRVTEPPAPPAPKPEPQPEPQAEAPAEPKVASFIASSLRDIARPITLDTTPHAKPPAAPVAERRIEQLLALDSAPEDDDRPFDWRGPVIGVGAVVLTAGLIGALAGVSVRDDVQNQQVPLAAVAKPRAPVAAPAKAAPAAVPVVALVAPAPTGRPVVRPKRIVAAAQPDPLAPQPDEALASADQAADAPSNATPAQSALVQEAAADLPLAKSVIARTIRRIGYTCGEVASTEAVEGAPGVFNVTCASGDTYRAAPVRGRYRFRHVGRH
jgi:hypothetical protein